MKKNLLLLCLTALTVIFISSCCKEDLPDKHQTKSEFQNITIELNKNQTYHFTLPENLSGRLFRITEQAKHFTVSEISGDKIYTYTPAHNYTGSDKVIITNSKEQQNNGCGNNNNNNSGYHDVDGNSNGCNQDQNTKVEQTITINFIINEKEQGKNFRAVVCPVF